MVSDAECEEKALAWSKLIDGSINFSLDEEKEVSLGIIVNLTGQSSFGINAFKLEGVTIEPLAPSDPTGIQTIDNGQLTVDNETGAIYDLSGRRVSAKANKKGVYIVNGKKVVIK